MLKYRCLVCLARDYPPCYDVRELLTGTARRVIAVGLFIWMFLGRFSEGNHLATADFGVSDCASWRVPDPCLRFGAFQGDCPLGSLFGI